MTPLNPHYGILLKIASVLGFTLMSACVKAASEAVPTGQVCFCRSFFALLTIVAWLAWRGELPAALYTRWPLGHLWRGLLGLTAMGLNFLALGLLPLPDAIALGYAMPLFATMFAALLLGEVVRQFRWTAVLVGLAGVMIILWPRLAFLKCEAGAAGETLGAICALTGAAVIALGAVVAVRLVALERSSTVVFYFSAVCSAGFLLTLPFGWRWPDAETLAILVACGVLGGISQLLVTECYRQAGTSIVAPFEYTSILFGIALGYLLFSEMPTGVMLLGSAVVIAASLMVFWREHQLRIERAHVVGSWPWALISEERE